MIKIIFLAAVAILVATHAAVPKPRATKANLNVGNTTAGDRLLLRQYVNRAALPNTIQYQDVIYRGNITTRISAVQATEVGGTHYGSAWILSGGIGQANVTVRVQSARGYGFYYLLDIWGR